MMNKVNYMLYLVQMVVTIFTKKLLKEYRMHLFTQEKYIKLE